MFQAIQRRVAGRGPGEIVKLAARTLADAVQSLGPGAAAGRRRDAEFDRRWGTDTSGLVNLSSLSVDPVRARYGVRYQPSSSDALARAVAAFGIEPSKWRFVDYGSGKGRIVLTAAAIGFASAVGVEFSPELCGIAEENARRFAEKGGAAVPPEFVLGDAGAFEPPEGPLFAYLYNPFGPPVLDEVAARLAAKAARGEPVLVAYAHPQHLDLFMSYGRWNLERSEADLALLRSV
jgi:hypothetical protein